MAGVAEAAAKVVAQAVAEVVAEAVAEAIAEAVAEAMAEVVAEAVAEVAATTEVKYEAILRQICGYSAVQWAPFRHFHAPSLFLSKSCLFSPFVRLLPCERGSIPRSPDTWIANFIASSIRSYP